MLFLDELYTNLVLLSWQFKDWGFSLHYFTEMCFICLIVILSVTEKQSLVKCIVPVIGKALWFPNSQTVAQWLINTPKHRYTIVTKNTHIIIIILLLFVISQWFTPLFHNCTSGSVVPTCTVYIVCLYCYTVVHTVQKSHCKLGVNTLYVMGCNLRHYPIICMTSCGNDCRFIQTLYKYLTFV